MPLRLLVLIMADDLGWADPGLPYVYGQKENEEAPEWVKRHVEAIRATQPKHWPEGETPWPQAPKDGVIIYTGDGR